MHCSKATQQLQLYIDKRLPLDHMRLLEIHISLCTTCREELFLLEKIEHALHEMEFIAEPPGLTVSIMQRVALSPLRAEKRPYILLFPSLPELMAVVLLATVTTFGVILGQPSLREALPIIQGAFTTILHLLASINSATLMLVLWIIGTVLGVWITLVVAGDEMRTEWYKAVIDHLPVW
jgi:hypothetical protein